MHFLTNQYQYIQLINYINKQIYRLDKLYINRFSEETITFLHK